MSETDDLLIGEFRKLPPRPAETASQADKKRYSELMSAAAARALAEALRRKGLRQTLPLATADSDNAAKTDTSDEIEG